jgi:NADH dehydrogenase
VEAARRLRGRLPPGWETILFSRENHFVFTPLLPDAVGSAINPLHFVRPIRQMCRGVACRTADVTRVDFRRREVGFRSGDREGVQSYDQLVVAVGSVTKLDLVPGMAAHAWPARTLGDVLALRNHLIGRMEQAEIETDPDRKRRLLSFVVVGGGFSGVEIAGEIFDLLTASCRFYGRVRKEEIRVTLAEGKDRILSLLPASLSDFALRKMRARGIDIRLSVRIRAVTETGVRLVSGEEIDAGTVVCTIGTTVHPLVASMGFAMEGDRIRTGPDMRVEDRPDVWAIGDCARVVNAADGRVSPATAQFAVRQGEQLAENLARVARGRPTRPFRFRYIGELVSIGRRNAVGEIFGLRVSGFPAWFIWRGVYLGKMPTLMRKIQVAFDWALEILMPRDIVKVDLGRTERFGRVHLEPGQFVFRRGDPADRFYVIERGRAARLLDEGGPPTATLGPGDHFGELSLLDQGRRITSIRAEEPLDLLTIDPRLFSDLVRNMAALRAEVERSARRIRSARDFALFARDHPALQGRLASDAMSRPAATLPETATLSDAVARFRSERKGCFPVVDAEGRMAGILTRTDLYRALVDLRPANSPVRDLMTPSVISIPGSATLTEAIECFIREPVKHLVVAEEGRPIGVLTPLDVLEAVTRA